MTVLQMAARAWQREQSTRWVNWWCSPSCQAYYNAAVCGLPVTGSSEGCRVRLAEALGGQRLERGISVGCAAGGKEIALLAQGLLHEFDLWEIAPRFVSEGQAAAAAAGVGPRVHYHVGDALQQEQPGSYDLVYWDHSLHHMTDVRRALAWSLEALRPNGFLLINDYIGPNRLQFTGPEVEAANAFLERHGLARRVQRTTPLSRLRQWYRDPSEAPQSELIEAAVTQTLPGATVTRIGGTFLNMLGSIVVPDRDDSDPLLHEMIAADAELRERGWSHFAFCLWKKPGP